MNATKSFSGKASKHQGVSASLLFGLSRFQTDKLVLNLIHRVVRVVNYNRFFFVADLLHTSLWTHQSEASSRTEQCVGYVPVQVAGAYTSFSLQKRRQPASRRPMMPLIYGLAGVLEVVGQGGMLCNKP